jgi:hypothetical protein
MIAGGILVIYPCDLMTGGTPHHSKSVHIKHHLGDRGGLGFLFRCVFLFGTPLQIGAVGGFIQTMALLFPAFPMVRGAALGAKDHVILFGKGAMAHHALLCFLYVRNRNHLKINLKTLL